MRDHEQCHNIGIIQFTYSENLIFHLYVRRKVAKICATVLIFIYYAHKLLSSLPFWGELLWHIWELNVGNVQYCTIRAYGWQNWSGTCAHIVFLEHLRPKTSGKENFFGSDGFIICSTVSYFFSHTSHSCQK